MRSMNEAQAWEQLYGRRSPDVRVLGQESDALDADAEDASDAYERGYVARADQQPPASEAHAA
jgi:hypothetical protein